MGDADDRAAELAAAIEGRDHWRLWGPVAVYAPPGATAEVHVRALASAPRARERWAAIVIRAGAAEHSRLAGTAIEAVRWAERVNLS